MSVSMNKVILIGRLGKDPQVREVGDTSVANFSLATDESYKDRDGEKQKKTEWHNIVVWGNSAKNFVEPYLHCGDLIMVEGKLQTRKWTDKDGNDKYTTEINVTNIQPVITGNSGAAQDRGTKSATTKAKPKTQTKAREQEPAGDTGDVERGEITF
jgi:single-strand DNA-binding protein